MDDPTTMALNLTFFGTLGVAFLMLLCLGILVTLTLVLAGIGRLVFLILMALFGIVPKKEKDTVPIVHLPAKPYHRPHPGFDAEADSVTGTLDGSAAAPQYHHRAEPVQDRLAGLRQALARLAGGSSAKYKAALVRMRGIQWKTLFDARRLPTPAQIKAGASAKAHTVVETQAKHHPLVVAARKVPPVLSPKWAAAVEEADRRAAERAKAAALPEVKVTVRDIPAGGSVEGDGKAREGKAPKGKAPKGQATEPHSAEAKKTAPTMQSSKP
ncbi:hypothetical protein [Arthrobacter sp. ISL-30]|uniref:hypothetical protein n=1 Tax=Arthrobacter sp. ISL-30 TaxID=2819109 RepID=UPI001BEA9F99|nr:hypothetical protein [Arthrobacter sp. ISL-30]MBT2514749.1 hypothetical protein [Arthrobacter sp. ISL-30]